MIRQVLARWDLPVLSTIGLMLFLLVFVGALVWVFRKGSSGFYAELERMPLERPEGLSHE